MRRVLLLSLSVVLVVAACGDDTESAESTTGPPATTVVAPTTLPVPTTVATTTPPTSTTAAPSSTTVAPATEAPSTGAWAVVAPTLPVDPGCCDMPATGPTSPEGAIPIETWPADGFYWAEVGRGAESAGVLQLALRRWVPCAALPDRCAPEPPTDGITSDPASEVSRTLTLDDDLTVVIRGVVPMEADPASAAVIEGNGTAFDSLCTDGLDRAYVEWVVEPYEAGRSVEDIETELMAASADPTFPFGPEPSHGYPLAYRGPQGTYLVAHPSWLMSDGDVWPPGWNGLYNWWTTLEIRDGKPILYIDAGQIAG